MGAIGESRSKETSNHVKRVACYSELLGKYYGLDPETIELIKEASPMHDIGKVAIPDSILNKNSALTAQEKKIMQDHSLLGYEMLKHSQRPLLKTAAIIAYEHHEKYDGTGYPKGLKGEEISIYGRITAIADVFDALGSDRCYKKAWEDEKIITMIKEESGKHFDPKLVEIFLENLDEFCAIRDKYKDILE
jgi:putative nucleotidyltransferase with HDIG domain